jgi:hypothetical protein
MKIFEQRQKEIPALEENLAREAISCCYHPFEFGAHWRLQWRIKPRSLFSVGDLRVQSLNSESGKTGQLDRAPTPKS